MQKDFKEREALPERVRLARDLRDKICCFLGMDSPFANIQQQIRVPTEAPETWVALGTRSRVRSTIGAGNSPG